ncbi:MAG: slipin family protein [Polyangiaceae bacterium]|nr:slipin family protein [Polyangiaceae bacterium]
MPILALGIVLLILFLLLFSGIKQINQWETALKFTLGKYSGRAEPGLTLVLPIFQQLRRIDMRTRNRDLLRQMVITRDNVTTMVDAVVYYRVIDPEKAALAVENYEAAVKDRAKVVLRDVVGETPLDQLLAHREEVAAKVRAQVETVVNQWGLHVELIGLQDVQLPPQMQEVLAKAAIAERDRKYVIIKSQADVESAKNFAQAAEILMSSPGAMELRRFETLANLAQSGATKVVFDLAKPYDGHDTRKIALTAAETAGEVAPRAQKTGLHAADQAAVAQAEYEAQAVQEAQAALAAQKARRNG